MAFSHIPAAIHAGVIARSSDSRIFAMSPQPSRKKVFL
jgi:hypothetical protein